MKILYRIPFADKWSLHLVSPLLIDFTRVFSLIFVCVVQGKSVNVMIVDACGGCSGSTDLDFSPAAFSQLADESLGRIDITWEWA